MSLANTRTLGQFRRWADPGCGEGRMFLVQGRTDASSVNIGVSSAKEAIGKRNELAAKHMAVTVMTLNGEIVPPDELQKLAEDKPLKGCRLLLVEDDCFIGLEMDDILRDAGAEIVGPILDVESAMKEARHSSFGVAILDVNIHGGLTYDIADELNRNEIPFIFMSGYKREHLPERFWHVPFWPKPIHKHLVVSGLVDIFASALRLHP